MIRHSTLLAAVLLSWTASVAGTSLASSAPAPRFPDAFGVTVSSEDDTSLASTRLPSVLEVRDFLQAAQPALPASVESIRALLVDEYAELVSETEALYYTWVWDEERQEYVLVCCSNTRFRIGLADAVIVSVEELTALD